MSSNRCVQTESAPAPVDFALKSWPVFFTTSRTFVDRAKFTASCTCATFVASTTCDGMPPRLHPAPFRASDGGMQLTPSKIG